MFISTSSCDMWTQMFGMGMCQHGCIKRTGYLGCIPRWHPFHSKLLTGRIRWKYFSFAFTFLGPQSTNIRVLLIRDLLLALSSHEWHENKYFTERALWDFSVYPMDQTLIIQRVIFTEWCVMLKKCMWVSEKSFQGRCVSHDPASLTIASTSKSPQSPALYIRVPRHISTTASIFLEHVVKPNQPPRTPVTLSKMYKPYS